MDKSIIEQFLLNTMLIENEWGKRGSGFLVKREITKDSMKIFLVTNKHVIHTKKEKRDEAKEITIYFNVKGENDSIKGHSVKYLLQYQESRLTREHPNKDVDVLAVDITSIFKTVSNIAVKFIDFSLFANKEKIQDQKISIGEDAIVIGYPLGLKHYTTNFPLVRKTTIASKIGEELEIPTKENGTTRNRILRGFLIDGGTSPGSSGSPVIFSPGAIGMNERGITLGIRPPLVLGIVSEARLAIIETSVGDSINLSGLSLAFDADTIIETIEQFF